MSRFPLRWTRSRVLGLLRCMPCVCGTLLLVLLIAVGSARRPSASPHGPALPRLTPTITLTGHDGGVLCLAFSPKGSILASGGVDNTVTVWDLSKGIVVMTLKGHRDPIYAVVFSPDGEALISGGYDNTIRIWDTRNWKERLTVQAGFRSGVVGLAIRPDGRIIAAAGGSDDATVKLFETRTGKPLAALAGHRQGVESLSFSANGEALASADHGGRIIIWDLPNKREGLTLKSLGQQVSRVAYLPDGRLVVSQFAEKRIDLCDAVSGEVEDSLPGPEDMTALARSRDGHYTAVSGGEGYRIPGEVWLYDMPRRCARLKFACHNGGINCLEFSPDSKQIATASRDATIMLWDVNKLLE